MIPNLSPLDGHSITDRLKSLARHTDVPGTLTRLTLSASNRAAADEVEGLMRAAGMTTRLDALGNVRGRWAGATPDAPTVIIGSHIDSVRDGGIYDGDLGVMLGIAVVEELRRQGKRLACAVEVVAFADEEGVRFGSSMSGSRALAGTMNPAQLEEVDDDGVTRRDALAAFGVDPSAWAAEKVDPARTLGYLEVHIEQGPVLESEDLALGVVTAIQGTSRALVTVTGMAGHAGTLPMEARRDALTAASQMILAVEAEARGSPLLRATVGRIEVPNASVNVVPGTVRFTIDTRSHDDAARAAGNAAIRSKILAIAAARDVTAEVTGTYDSPAAPCDPRFQDALERAIVAEGQRPFRLASGAGHDAMSFKDVIPHAMLFVRCKDGISHNPAEYCAPDDISLAARALYRTIEDIGARP